MWYSFSLPLYLLLSHIIMNLQIFIYAMSLVNFSYSYWCLSCISLYLWPVEVPLCWMLCPFDLANKSDHLLAFWHKGYPRLIKYLWFLKSGAIPYHWSSQLYHLGTRWAHCSWAFFTFKLLLLWELVNIYLGGKK